MSDQASGLRLAEVRELLDDALVRLATAEGDARARRDAALAMAAAIADVDSALADPARFQEGTASALSRIRSAAAAAPAEARPGRGAAGELARCVTALASVRWEPRGKAPPPAAGDKPLLRATVGEPALLDLARAPLRPLGLVLAKDVPDPIPAIEIPEEIVEPPPMTLAELEAALAEATADEPEPEETTAEPEIEPREQAAPASEAGTDLAYFGAALPEEHVLFDRARTCLEDLALLGSMRRPLADQSWTGRAEPERRLLARVDAIAACGDGVFPRVAALLEERPLPDPEFTWALIFLFGSIAGDDAAEQAMRLARIAPLDGEGMVDAVSDALALAPHPKLGSSLQAWLSDPAPERRIAGVRALARRGSLTSVHAVAAAMDADLRVAGAGTIALRTASGSVDPAVLTKLARHDDESVARAALESAIIRRSAIAARRAAQLVEEGRPDFAGAASILAISAGAEALEPLRKAAAAGSAAAIEALGWYGHPDAIEDLLGLLSGEKAASAVLALQLITGASLTDADPEPRWEEGEAPFTATDGPVPAPTVLSTDAGVWRAFWEKREKAVRAGTRYRFGHPWSLEDDLRQIESRLATRAERWPAYLELCARSGGNLPFDPDAFVARQRAQIAAWSTYLAQRRGSQGWPVRLERA